MAWLEALRATGITGGTEEGTEKGGVTSVSEEGGVTGVISL